MNDYNKIGDFGTDIRIAKRPRRESPWDNEVMRADEDEEIKDKVKPCQWSEVKYNTYLPVGSSIPILKPGFYKLVRIRGDIHFELQNLAIDTIIEFKDSVAYKILSEIDSFWKNKELFSEYGFLHKRGYLFYGPQGSGKTMLIQQIIHKIILDGGIAFSGESPPNLGEALNIFRTVEPDRPVVCLFEDLDSIVDVWGESNVLSILDGEIQIDKVLNVASTNYPERLDRRLAGRPRRFDRLIEIGMPNKNIRKEYFMKKLNISKQESAKWADKTEGFSFAALSELVVSVKCLNKGFDEAVELLAKLMDCKANSDTYFKTKTGFDAK